MISVDSSLSAGAAAVIIAAPASGPSGVTELLSGSRSEVVVQGSRASATTATRGWNATGPITALEELRGADGQDRGGETIVGLPDREVRRLGSDRSVGAAAPMFALAAADTETGGTSDGRLYVIAFDTAAAEAP
jgi:hypothetical protein